MDMELDMEVEAAAQVSVIKEEKDEASTANNNNNNNSISSLLASARQHINEGNPSLALQTVVIAMRLFGGENAVVWTLEKARQLYQNRIRENAAADELTALFAECAIAEASPNVSIEPVQSNCPVSEASPTVPVEPVQNNNTSQVTASTNSEVNESSILAETGRMQVVVDAAADGSSFICLRCGGLVSNSRREEHLAYWCG